MASGLLKIKSRVPVRNKVPSARQGMRALFLIIHMPEVSLSIIKTFKASRLFVRSTLLKIKCFSDEKRLALKLFYQSEKVLFIGSHHLPKFRGTNPKVTTTVTLQELTMKQEISNEDKDNDIIFMTSCVNTSVDTRVTNS